MSKMTPIFDIFADGVLVLDNYHNVVYGNEPISVFLNTTSKRLSRGKSLDNFLKLEPNPLVKFHGGVQASSFREVKFLTAEGVEGWCQISLISCPSEILRKVVSDESVFDDDRLIIMSLRDVSLEKNLHEKYKSQLNQKELVIKRLELAQAKLADYSKNLESKVTVRTKELETTNLLMKTILDSLGQAILVFDKEGKCLPVFSQVCSDILETIPEGLQIEEVLSLEGSEVETFRKWLEVVFSLALDFEDLKPLAPRYYKHSEERRIELNYQPLKSENSNISGVVLIATDKTREVQAENLARFEKELVDRVVRVSRNKDSFLSFFTEVERFFRIFKEEKNYNIQKLKNSLHTLKGGAGSFAFYTFSGIIHEIEDGFGKAMGDFGDGLPDSVLLKIAQAEQVFRSQFIELDQMIGPLRKCTVDQQVEMSASDFEKLLSSASLPSDILSDLLKRFETMTETKKIGSLVSHWPELAVDISHQLGKKVELRVLGKELRIPNKFSGLISQLIHPIRNAIDHGIESPEDREMKGKDSTGVLKVNFKYDGSSFEIEVWDDGRGISVDRLKTKLIQAGINLDGLSNQEIIQYIFQENLSTCDKVSTVSGRGVGMNSIYQEVKKLGGICRVDTEAGAGSVLTISIPYQLKRVFSKAS